MEDGSEGKFWSGLSGLFRNRNEEGLEEVINAAKLEGSVASDEAVMILNILSLEDKQISEIMVPRPDIVCADIEDSLESVGELMVAHGHSRIPIYKENRDNILGVVHSKDLLRPLLNPDKSSLRIEQIMGKPILVPESTNLKVMLQEFRGKRKHLAIALDEYGGTSGLVTLEDVLEEIVGDIEDEHDPHKPREIQDLGNGAFLVAGRVGLEELEEKTGISLRSEEVESLGGYLGQMAGRVPRQGDFFSLDEHKYTVKEASRRQVRWVLIEPLSGKV